VQVSGQYNRNGEEVLLRFKVMERPSIGALGKMKVPWMTWYKKKQLQGLPSTGQCGQITEVQETAIIHSPVPSADLEHKLFYCMIQAS